MSSDLVQKIFLILSSAVILIGCRSTDLTANYSGPAPRCEIHGKEMHPEWINVSSGNIVYMLSYLDIEKKQFPHHGDFLLSGERDFEQPLDRRVRDFVCPDCTKAFREYWQTNHLH